MKKPKDMTADEFIDASQYAIVAVQDNKILHFCGYIDKPDEENFAHLDEELQSDSEFNLIGVDYDLYLCPDDLFQQIKSDFLKQRAMGNVNIVTNEENE